MIGQLHLFHNWTGPFRRECCQKKLLGLVYLCILLVCDGMGLCIVFNQACIGQFLLLPLTDVVSFLLVHLLSFVLYIQNLVVVFLIDVIIYTVQMEYHMMFSTVMFNVKRSSTRSVIQVTSRCGIISVMLCIIARSISYP